MNLCSQIPSRGIIGWYKCFCKYGHWCLFLVTETRCFGYLSSNSLCNSQKYQKRSKNRLQQSNFWRHWNTQQRQLDFLWEYMWDLWNIRAFSFTCLWSEDLLHSKRRVSLSFLILRVLLVHCVQMELGIGPIFSSARKVFPAPPSLFPSYQGSHICCTFSY